ncbi:hypothetical protein ZHAS_00019113 [Anopheles sinensis]|uniref:Uncharacterized protein n=1 Tax=Anopheles sinensis TaxID=74873 RepID=A0A084WLG5_ANOSI|nr:hypothetical protein ZHAS_00019113 [Anopheles sinensis]
MLLTSLLSSASSLAVPSGAQKHFESTGDPHADAAPGSAPGADSVEENRPDLFNLTLTAMRHYLRNHLNASRYGKAPRKRSHVQVDAVDVEFYRRFKEFNSSQAALDGVTNLSDQLHHNTTPTDRNSGVNGTGVGQDHPGVGVGDAPDAAGAVTAAGSGPSSPTSTSSLPAAPSSGQSSATGSQRDYSVLMDDPRGYITASASLPSRPSKTSTPWNTSFVQHRENEHGFRRGGCAHVSTAVSQFTV